MATDGMTDVFRIYLATCSDEMASQIVDALQQANRIDPNAGPSMIVSSSAPKKIAKKQRKNAKSALETGGPKRPLNSWMAFRKYYNRVLTSYTQKAISKVLTQLWKADPFTAKWALLAKAYSIVRGCGSKDDAPLDAFFAICAPLVGIIPPADYLDAMGWALSPPEDGDQERVPQLTRLFEPTVDALEPMFPLVATTNYGVEDLVVHCYAVGYGNPSNNGSQSASSHGSLTMASRPTAIMTDEMSETMHMTPSAQMDTTAAFDEVTHDSSMDTTAAFDEVTHDSSMDTAAAFDEVTHDGSMDTTAAFDEVTHDSSMDADFDLLLAAAAVSPMSNNGFDDELPSFDVGNAVAQDMLHQAVIAVGDAQYPYADVNLEYPMDLTAGDKWDSFDMWDAYVNYTGK